jgi:crotonobetainyl-CoA:carnitine CoA-transferase CaiB-like acyl-CoA transferase
MLPLKGIAVAAVEQPSPRRSRRQPPTSARDQDRAARWRDCPRLDTTVKGLSSYFVWLNRSKESLTLDLKRPEAAGAFARLIARADVFVQNLAPGAADRLGTATSVLRDRHPRLIVCNVSGYGVSGPYSQKKAYDLLLQSEVGLVSITLR